MQLINPATLEVAGTAPHHSPAEVEAMLDAAGRAFALWRCVSLADRARHLGRAADLMRRRASDLAAIMAREMGKPVTAGEAEVHKCAAACDYFAHEAQSFLAPRAIATEASHSYVRYDPLGPVLAIMPWNFPFWQVIRFAAPALMAGNVGVLKHAPNVPGCAMAIAEVWRDAGLPEGVWTTLFLSNEETQALIGHRAIAAVTLTGSARAGMAVAGAAAESLKKSVLELGGSDAFIVLADADPVAAARAAAAARCINSGQSCIAAKRFIVEEPLRARFQEAMVSAMADMRVGDPLARATQLGPLARADLLATLDDQVRRSVDAGAKCLTGGRRLPGRGYFYAPTVLSEVRPGMAAFDEETFGPVAAVIGARDAEDAVRLANQSRYGLGASIWTPDVRRAQDLAGRLEAGCVFVNEAVKSDPRLPFGGIKHSGWGRELAEEGIREFTDVKTVWVR